MGTGEKYNIYVCDTEQKVWHGHIKDACLIPMHISEGASIYLQIQNISSEKSSAIIGWRQQ